MLRQDARRKASLQEDFSLFQNPSKLREEGVMLRDPYLEGNSGRVFFSLNEIPLYRTFETYNQNIVKRETNSELRISKRDGSVSLLLSSASLYDAECSDDFRYWADTQSDLSILTDQRLLAENGVVLFHSINGEKSLIHSLTELPLNVKFFTLNSTLVERVAITQVFIAERCITISVGDSEEGSKKSAGGTEETLGTFTESQDSISDEEGDAEEEDNTSDESGANEETVPVPTVITSPSKSSSRPSLVPTLRLNSLKIGAVLQEDSDDLQQKTTPRSSRIRDSMPKLGTPKIESSCGVDVFYHSSTLTVHVPPLPEDVDPDLVIETVWEKSTRQRSLYRKIESAGNSREYHPNIDDQESFIRAGLTLVNPDGIRGITVFSSPVFITVDPKVKKEVESNVEVSVAIFKVLAKMCDQDCLKRLLFLNKRHLKIRKKDTTIFKCRWNTEQLSILPHSCTSIIISFPGESNTIITVELVTPDTFHRDIIYLTLIRFQSENMGPSRLSYSVPSSSGKSRLQYVSSGSR